jgi:mxaK protein
VRQLRVAAAAIVFAASLAALIVYGVRLLELRAGNVLMARYDAGQDQLLPRDASVGLHAARGLFLLAHDRVDDAQTELDAIGLVNMPGPRSLLLYGLANAHFRRVLNIFSSAPMRKVAPLIGLAQSEYRQVLRADPGNWNARYNFDIASALSHDPEVAAFLSGDDMARERALVPDAPGAPNGLP